MTNPTSTTSQSVRVTNGERVIPTVGTNSTFKLPNIRSNLKSSPPEDLREWLSTSDLIALVHEAVKTLYWDCQENPSESAAHRSANGEDKQPVQSTSSQTHLQIVLGLLTYCYTIGVYAADEIERRIPTDTALRYLCGNTQVAARQLCLVRSHNRELLRHCLSRVLWRACEIRSETSFKLIAEARFDLALRKHFHTAAGERIYRALEADREASQSHSTTLPGLARGVDEEAALLSLMPEKFLEAFLPSYLSL